MKKTVLILALMILAISCVFAGTHSVKAGMTAYGFQGFTSSEKGVSGFHNRYGLGGNLAYEYDINDRWFAGLDVRCVTNWIKERKNLTDLSVLPRAGYRFAQKGKFDAYLAGEYGLNFQFFEETDSTLMEFGIVNGVRYSFSDNFAAYGELENLYQFAKKDKVNYSNIKLNVNLGVEYEF